MVKETLHNKRPESCNKRELVSSWEEGTSDLPTLIASSLAQAKFLLVAFFIFSMPLVIYLPNTSYTYTKSIFSLVMISILFILWAIEAIFRRKNGYNLYLQITPLLVPLLVLIGVAALSMVNSQSLTVSLSSLAQFIYFVAFYLLLVTTIEDLRQGIILLGCLLAAGSLIAIYALLQYYQILPGPLGASGSEAIISTLGNKNYVAEFLSFLFVPGLIPLFQGRHLLVRLLSLAGLGLIIAVLFIAGSKGAWFALTISLLFFAIGLIIFRLSEGIRQGRSWIWPMLGLAVIVSLAVAGMQLSHFSSLIAPQPVATSSPSSQDESINLKPYSITQANSYNNGEISSQLFPEEGARMQRSILLRIWNWRSGWEMLKDHPLLGIGLGNYKLRFLSYKARLLKAEWNKQVYNFYISRSAQAHNEYVQIAAEMGGLGILAFSWMFWMLLRGIGRIRSGGPKAGFICLCLYGGVIAFLADSGVSFPLHRPASALVPAVLMGLLHAKALFSFQMKSSFASTAKLTRRGIGVLVISALVVTAVMGVTVMAYRDFRANLYLEAGSLDLELGNPLDAEKKLERSRQLTFQPAVPLFYLGETYWELGDYQRAAYCLEQSLPGMVTETTYLLLAQIYAKLNDDEKAWEYLHQLLATEPHPNQKVQAYYLRAQLFQRRGDLKMALAQLEHIIQQATGLVQVKAYVLTAELYFDQGELESARTFYRQGLEEAEAQLEQKKNTLKAHLTSQEVPLSQYAQLASEIEQLEKQVKEIRFVLRELLKL